jgi:hypothetical protein
MPAPSFEANNWCSVARMTECRAYRLAAERGISARKYTMRVHIERRARDTRT